MAGLLVYCPKCCAYIPAVACDEQGNTGTPPKVAVPYSIYSTFDDDVTYFSYAGYCYSVDKTQTPDKRPKGYIKLSSYTPYDDCHACAVANTSGGGGGGSPGGGGGGGGGGNPGGGGGPTSPGHGYKGFPVEGQPGSPPAYIWVLIPGWIDGDDPPAEQPRGWFRYGAWCYYVEWDGDTDPEEIPPTDPWVYGPPLLDLTFYDDAEDCIGGIPAAFCANQQLPPNALWPWMRAKNAPSSVITVRIDGLCWSFSPATSTTPIPANAKIVTVSNQYDGCAKCVKGVLATLCTFDGRPQINAVKAPRLWVPETYLPDDDDDVETPVWKYLGWCYKVDPHGSRVVRPADAITSFARDQYFGSCDNCLCADPRSVNGIKAVVCEGQQNAYAAPDVWVAEENLPDDVSYFLWRNFCYSVDPTKDVQRMPAGAILVDPSGEYLDCADCVNDQEDDPCSGPNPPEDCCQDGQDCGGGGGGGGGGPGGGGGGGGGGPGGGGGGGGGGDPPGGGGDPFPPPDPTTKSYALFTCDGDDAGRSISALDSDGNPTGLAGRYIVLDGDCFYVSYTQSPLAAPVYFGAVYVTCPSCGESQCPCADEGPRLAHVTANYLDDTVAWFTGSYPAGSYQIGYVRGALNYCFTCEGGGYFEVNDFAVSPHGYHIVAEDPTTLDVTVLERAPGISNIIYHSQQEVEDASEDECFFTTINHPGGRIGIRLDDSPYIDNAIDTSDPNPSAPVFKICEGDGGGGPGPCPTDCSSCCSSYSMSVTGAYTPEFGDDYFNTSASVDIQASPPFPECFWSGFDSEEFTNVQGTLYCVDGIWYADWADGFALCGPMTFTLGPGSCPPTGTFASPSADEGTLLCWSHVDDPADVSGAVLTISGC